MMALMVGAIPLVAGCSNNGNSASSASNSPSAGTGTGNAAELAPYEVSLYFPGDPQKDTPLVEQELNKILKEKFNASIKIVQIGWGDFKQKTDLMMSTGEKMDLVFSPWWNNFFTNIPKGAYWELNDDSAPHGNLLEQYGQGIKKTINPMFLQAPVVNGKLYAIPTNKEIAQGTGFFFRKDAVEKYGLDWQSVKTMEDLEPLLKAVKEKAPELQPAFISKGFGLGWDDEASYLNGYKSFAAPYVYVNHTGDTKVLPLTDPAIHEPMKQRFQLYRNWYEAGYINKDSATSQVNKDDLRKAGKLWWEMHATKPGDIGEMRLKNEGGSGPENFEYVKVDTIAPLVTTEAATGAQIAISRTSKDPARAMMVLDLMHTDKDVINLLVNGIEGKHYTKTGENRIEPILNSGYDPGAAWMLGNQLLNYLRPGQIDDLPEQMKKFNDTANKSKLLGFVFDPTSVQSEIGQLNNINEEFGQALSSGAIDVDSFMANLLEKVKAAGVDKVAQEIQKQLDAWLAAQ